MHETAYAALLVYLGREEKPPILDPVQRIVLASEEVLRELGVDTRYLYPEAPAGWKYQEDTEGCWRDEFGVTYKRVGFYADCVGPALRGADLAAVKAYGSPIPPMLPGFAGCGKRPSPCTREPTMPSCPERCSASTICAGSCAACRTR